MQRAALSQSLMSHLPAGAHLPWTDAADGKPRGCLCTSASQPLAVTVGSGTNTGKQLGLQWQGLSHRQILQSKLWENTAVGDTLQVLLSQLLWAQVKHRAQPRAEHQVGVEGVQLRWDPNQSFLFSKDRLSVALSIFLCTWCTLIVPGSEKQAQWSSKGDARRLGSVLVPRFQQYTSCLLLSWSHTQEKVVTALVTKAAPTELLPAGLGNIAEAKFITVTPEINLASGTMASCS